VTTVALPVLVPVLLVKFVVVVVALCGCYERLIAMTTSCYLLLSLHLQLERP